MFHNEKEVQKVHTLLNQCDAIVVGAGAGLSTAAGHHYTGRRFTENFPDFIQKYGYKDMYSAGFQRYETREEHWAYWSRHILLNRYTESSWTPYHHLLQLIKDKPYFVLTTNVDHVFQRTGFDKERLFYTQGDYGLWQCSIPCHEQTYHNEEAVRKMVDTQIDMKIPTELVPCCPICGAEMAMNLRADHTFVEDEGWHKALGNYEDFLKAHTGKKVLFLELGVGYNTPGIIKYPFIRMVYQNKNAFYVTINLEAGRLTREISDRHIHLSGDIGETLEKLLEYQNI